MISLWKEGTCIKQKLACILRRYSILFTAASQNLVGTQQLYVSRHTSQLINPLVQELNSQCDVQETEI
jgi:hypothetical protein